ncbi:MAG: hypothetical protein ABJQ71_11520 [Roseibium sp.]
MSRQAKGPRLQFRKSRYSATGKLIERGKYVIRDGGKYISTGCFKGEIEKAEGKLAEYIIGKQQLQSDEAPTTENTVISHALAYYHSVKRPETMRPGSLDYYVDTLNEHWGDKPIARITPGTCREYARIREGKSARILLSTLRAAVNLHENDGLHSGKVNFFVPECGPPRDRFLNRDEAAKLLWFCWRHRGKQAIHKNRPGCEKAETAYYPLRHLVRFILIGLYTGSRAKTILAASPYKAPGHAYVDLENGIFYRLPFGKKTDQQTSTTQPAPASTSGSHEAVAFKGVNEHPFCRIPRDADKDQHQERISNRQEWRRPV